MAISGYFCQFKYSFYLPSLCELNAHMHSNQLENGVPGRPPEFRFVIGCSGLSQYMCACAELWLPLSTWM